MSPFAAPRHGRPAALMNALATTTTDRVLRAPELATLRRHEREEHTRGARRLGHAVVGLGLVLCGSGGLVAHPLQVTVASLILLALAQACDRRPGMGDVATRWLVGHEMLALTAVGVMMTASQTLLSPATALLGPLAVVIGLRHRGSGLIASTGCLLLPVAATVIAAGDDGGSTASLVAAAVGALTLSAIAAMTSRLAHDDRVRRADSVLDPLTGLLNPAALDARIVELRGQATLDGLPMSIVLADLDGLEAINREHGIAAGDSVIAGAAEAMRRALRSFELLYRLGGDEFLLVLPGATITEATVLAERLRDAIIAARPHGHAITASFGIAGGTETTRPGWQFGALLAEADVAVYAAKVAGGDAVRTTATAADGPPAPARA